MKASLFFLTNLFSLFIFPVVANATDIYAEYQMTGKTSTPVINKMYSKDGNMRTDVIMNLRGRQMTTTTLWLKSKPNAAFGFNSMTKTYTETKINSAAAPKDVTIKVIGNEKVGNYNCIHFKMKSDGKSYDVWYTKNLPSFNFTIVGNRELSTQKMINEFKSKGITGMMVKMVLQTPGTKTSSMTMLLTKFDQKTLNSSLFSIPAGYKKSSVTLDSEKMKNMTMEQKKELMMKMMKEQQLKH